MVNYEIFGSGREQGCGGGDITHLIIKEKNVMLKKEDIIDMDENKGYRFWSNVYKNGKKVKDTKLKVEVIYNEVKGKYLRTQSDSTEKNNLLELLIYFYNKITKNGNLAYLK